MVDVEPFDRDRDLPAAQRIWEECRWVEDDDDKAALVHFLEGSAAWVGRLGPDAECLVTTAPGSVRHGAHDLDLAAVTAVTTSLVGRKQRLAGRVTARALVEAAEAGAAVSMLGMFEQGFYDQLGFGTGPYEDELTFDPATLSADLPFRIPVRLTTDDWADVHACLAARARPHGGVVLHPEGVTRAELAWTSTPFGLGHRDDTGRLTSFVWGEGKGENGPFKVQMLAHQTPRQLLELLGLLRSLGDQVRAVKLTEPAGIQLQDLIGHIGRQSLVGRGSPLGYTHTAGAWWQVRMLDLRRCVRAVAAPSPPIRFNLEVSDPLQRHGLTGVAGRWVVTLGESSDAEPGQAGDLPTLETTVNAFSRVWMGVRPAQALALTDHLVAPAELLVALDGVFAHLPPPRTGLDF